MSYATKRDSLVRTRQDLLVVGVRECQNHYASLVQQLLTRTEEMDHADWVKTSVTVTANNATAPDGTATADTVTFNATDDAISQTTTTPASDTAFTASVYLRIPAGAQTVSLEMWDSTLADFARVQCDLTTTWTRYYLGIRFTIPPAGTAMFQICRRIGDDATTVEVWGANMHVNPSNLNQAILFPYVERVAEAVGTVSVNASRCQVADNGDGSRCYYSRPTCQSVDDFNAGHTWENVDDRTSFTTGGLAAGPAVGVEALTARMRGIREFRFCRKDGPLPLPGSNLKPMLVSMPQAAQEIDRERAITINERVTFEFEDDEDPGLWNPVQAIDCGLVNTAVGAGTFWRRWAAIYRNYGNPEGYVIRRIGYVESGLTESDMPSRGRYLIRNYEAQDRRIRLVCADRLKITRKSIPAKIDTENYALGPLTDSQTTFTVNDATEITPPGTGYTVVLQLDHDSSDANGDGIPDLMEKVNVTAISGNVVTVQRGRWGTTAKAHAATQITIREIAEFGTERSTPSLEPLGKNPIDIIVELYRYAGLPLAEIDTVTLYDERDTWLPTTIDATAGTQYGPALRRSVINITDVETLVREIRDLTMLFLWVNNSQQLTGKCYAPLRPGQTIVTLTDDANILAGSIAVDDNDESRISRVLVAYHLPPGATRYSVAEDFLEVRVEIDVDSEEREYYGDNRHRALLTLWLQPLDFHSAEYFTTHILSRFKHGARILAASLEPKDDDIELGDFIRVNTEAIQDAHGNNLNSVMHVIKKRELADSKIRIECLDSGLSLRYGFYAAPGLPDYGSATAANKEYGYYGDTAGKVGSPLEPGYNYW